MLSWISSAEYESWQHIRDNFLDDPKSFPLTVETWLELRSFSRFDLSRISLVCPSFGLSYASFLGAESGMLTPWSGPYEKVFLHSDQKSSARTHRKLP